MFQAFRNFFKSKFGVIFSLLLLGVIAVAFAGGDVANLTDIGGVSGNDRVAIVGERKVSAAELDQAARNAIEGAKQQDPTVTMASFLNAERTDDLVNQLVERVGIAEFSRMLGLRAGLRLIDSEILNIPAFRGIDGEFDRDTMINLLSQRGMTEAEMRADLQDTLLARQLITPASLGSSMPEKVIARYAALLTERRNGWIAVLPSTAFAPKGKPTADQLANYYGENSEKYIRPERRVIRFAAFGPEVLGDLPAPTPAQIEARFKQDAAIYAASEKRELVQLVVPTEAAARAIVAEISGGASLESAAQAKGLGTAKIGPVTQNEYAAQSSAAAAKAAFSANQGALAAPARGNLGWFVTRVAKIDKKPAQTLAQVSGAIAQSLAQEQRRLAINELSESLEDQFYDGATLAEVAARFKLDVTTTQPATADGRIYQKPDQTLPPAMGSILQTAFAMEEGEPQLAELAPGQAFIIFDVQEITASAPAPLAQIKDRVSADWVQAQGSVGAKQAADRVMARMAKGQSLADALKAEKVALPAPDAVNMGRDQLQQAGQRIPPVLALLFSMAEGTHKRLEAPANNGWFIARLDAIETGKVEQGNPLLAQIRRDLAPLSGDEYAQQLARATLDNLGAEKNANAIAAVRAQLTGADVQ